MTTFEKKTVQLRWIIKGSNAPPPPQYILTQKEPSPNRVKARRVTRDICFGNFSLNPDIEMTLGSFLPTWLEWVELKMSSFPQPKKCYYRYALIFSLSLEQLLKECQIIYFSSWMNKRQEAKWLVELSSFAAKYVGW